MVIKNYLYFILFCLGSIFHIQAFSQSSIRFTHVDNSKGLPSNVINSITSDHLGFIWIGTSDGLCRYESANSIKIYQVDQPKVKGGLQSNVIKVLFPDSKGNLWIGTRYGGLTKYNQQKNEWITFTHSADDPTSISNNDVLTIEEDSADGIWIGTENGLNYFDPETNLFTSFLMDENDPSALQTKAILSILKDDKGWLWIGSWNGGFYLMLPPENGSPIADTKFRPFAHNGKPSKQNIWSLYQDRGKRYWIGTFGEGLTHMQLPSNASNDRHQQDWVPTFHNFKNNPKDANSLSHNSIEDIYQDSKNRLWIATVSGLNYVDLESLPFNNSEKDIAAIKFQQLYNESRNSQSLAHNEINSIHEDRQGLVWLSTISGISQYNYQANQFEFIDLSQTNISTFHFNNLYIDKNNIAWIGNGNTGLLLYNISAKKIISHPYKSIKDKYINTIYSPDNIHLYLGSNKGIFVLNVLTKTVKKYPLSKGLLQTFGILPINDFLKDSNNRLWIATDKGLFTLDEKTGKYTPHLHDNNDPTSISDNGITSVLEDVNQNIWIGTYNGLNRLSEKSSEKKLVFDRFKHDIQDTSSIFSNRIILLKKIAHTIYIGTTAGLGSYNIQTKKFTNHSISNFKYAIHAINITADNIIWASTSTGILKFDPSTNRFSEFVKQDGLEELTFGKGSCDEDTSGHSYFGSKGGLTKFYPNNIKTNTTPPPVFVTTVKSINSEEEHYIEAIYKDTLFLKSNNYYVSLDFTALNYNRGNKNKYAYKLIGLDEDWNYTSTNTSATYTNLKPGHYTFRVKAANNDGVWNETGATLHLVKPAAFHETIWYSLYIICSIILFLSTIFAVYMIGEKKRFRTIETYNLQLKKEVIAKEKTQEELQEREKQLNKKNEALKRSNQDLEQFAYVASHDLQSPLRTINSFSGLLESSLGDKLTPQETDFLGFITSSITSMQNLVDDLLTFSKVNANIRKIQIFDPLELLETIKIELDSELKEKNTTIAISDFPTTIHADKIQIKQLFQNLITNGIKFTKKDISPHLEISCQDEEKYWKFCVADNGIGISADYQNKIFKIFQRLHSAAEYDGTGIGLAICKKIVDRHEGKIWISSEIDKGSQFFFTISKDLD